MTKILYGKKWYRPREIASLGLIQNSSGTNNVHGNYKFILNQIKAGKLLAKNYSTTDRPYYLVSEDAINKYHETFDKVA